MSQRKFLRKISGLLLFILFLLQTSKAGAFSMLTHQAVVDGAWKSAIEPLLQQKYPEITPQQLQTARSYAYGGSIIQDIGYYPLGSKLFTNLTHYARTGDFVNSLFSEAQNSNEFAFAIGALSHYYADIHGHAIGTNLSVPLIYPELVGEFGTIITFEEDHKSHTRTEFAFDVLQASRYEYTPEAFRNFVGFKVATAQLDRAFQKTYGLKLKQVFINLPLSEWVFRLSVKSLIPQFTKIAWYRNRNKLEESKDSILTTSRQIASMSSEEYNKQFAKDYPGFWAKVMSQLFRVVPKVGPLSTLNFKIPTAQTEALFIKSLDQSVQNFEEGLFKLQAQPYLALAAYDLDTGSPTHQTEYHLADKTHHKLLQHQQKNDFRFTSGILQNYLLAYYENFPAPSGSKQAQKAYRETLADLQQLQQHKVKAGP